MKDLFSYRVTFAGCKKVKNCFLVVNDLPDEEMAKLYSKGPQNVDQEAIDILKNRSSFWEKQSDQGAPQTFLRRNIYVNISNNIILVNNTKRLEIRPYINKYWTSYQNLWNYDESVKIVSTPNSGFIIVTPLDLNSNILENYEVKVKLVQAESIKETLPENSTLLIFPDPKLLRSLFTLNGKDHYFATSYDPDSMGREIEMTTQNVCFLILLKSKKS